ncbi:hypothetical protein RIVM261_041140 [Rivularia sp. IAM M-261]|nr:hypothetical protein RIVM261_041140 [Rivularia sp. IAM M-261]
MSDTNLIFFGYNLPLGSKLINKIIDFYLKEEEVRFFKTSKVVTLKANVTGDDIEENIVVYENEKLQRLKLVDIADKNPELKDKILESFGGKENHIFICVLDDKYFLEDAEKKFLRTIHRSFEETGLKSFFCVVNAANSYDDNYTHNEYIRDELGFIFKSQNNSFDYQQYNKRVFFANFEGIAEDSKEDSKFLEFWRELKGSYAEALEENQEEISTAPKVEEVKKPKPVTVRKEVMPQLTQISPLINKIIEERGKQVRVITNYLENIHQINVAIQELRIALDNLLHHPQVTEELKFRLQEFENTSAPWSGEIVSSLNRFENVKNRLGRQAVTIGCSGQARVGKSTLLQTIGNLPEEAVPTGKGIPVTAVRSRLRHSQERRAILSLRDKKTFIDELIKPFHRELKLAEINYFEDFKNFDYDSNELVTDKNVELLTRLKQMQAALSSYESHLTGKTNKIEDLSQLRPWVAYPRQEEEGSPNCSRLYLAVKDIEIQCSFLVDVEKLMLVDLPGLGEVNVDAEQHHIQGLKNEVDLVLLILRPTAQSSYWSDKDRKALNLISQAVEGISRLGDFVMIIVNFGEQDDEELYRILINDIHKQLNENKPNSRYEVLTCNAVKPDSVREDVLVPVLNHLTSRLPIMDRDIIDSSFTQWKATVEKINVAIEELEESLRTFPSQAAGRSGEVFSKAKLLREKLSVELGKEIQELRKEIEAEREEDSIIDNQLIKVIEDKHQQIQSWAKNGLGRGKEKWHQDARGRFNLDKTVDAFAIEEINSARAYLTDTYSKLDIYFETKIEYLWRRISDIITACTEQLIRDTPPGREVLEKFVLYLGGKGIGDPFPSLREATEYLLKCGTENAIFQSHLLLRLVEETQKLAPEKFNFANISYQSSQAEEVVLEIILQRVIQTSFAVQKALREKPFVSTILFSAAVKFEDSLVRSTDADRQFFEFASLYTNEIWPEEFQAFEKNHAMVKKTEQAVVKLKQLLKKSSEG